MIRLCRQPPEAGNADQYDITRLTPLPDSPLRGRTVFFLGSSVTNGAASQHQALPEYFAARLGCRSIKEAVDGTTLANDAPDSYIQRLLPHLDREAVDLFVCQLSTNDAGQHKPLGETASGTDPADFDTRTVTGAIQWIIATVGRRWHCPVVFYTNARFDSPAYDAMVRRLKELQQKWQIGVLDLWSDAGFNAISPQQRALYMRDEIHPYRAGYRDWWCPELERQLLAYLAQNPVR